MLGKTYLAGSVRVELHPLVNVFPTSINNTRDPSGAIQPRATCDVGQNTQILLGGNFFWGPRGSEFGGIEIAGTDFTTRAADSVFAWLSYYF